MQPKGFKTRRLLLILLQASIASAAFGANPSEAAPRSVHPALRMPIDPTLPLRQLSLSRDARGVEMLDLFIKCDAPLEQLRAIGIEVNTVAGGLATARCPLGRLDALLALQGVERIQIAQRCEQTLDQSAPEVGLSTVRTLPPPNFTGETGAGVLVGIVDSGIDVGHADFQNPDGTTRLVSLWDQTGTGTPPAGFTYGTEWNAAQINAGQATEVDTDGHGSHVMGILGGDGSATGNGFPAFTFVGMAPNADLCVVKTTFGTTEIVDGVSYIFQRAAALGKRAVVNLSLSTQEGPHDGTVDFDVMISALTGPGKIVVSSAGNRQQDGLHGQLMLGAVGQSMTLSVPTYTQNLGVGNDYLLFSGWYEGADLASLTITTPRGSVVGPVATGASSTGNNTVDGYVNVFNGTTLPSNNDHEIYIEIFDNTASRVPRAGTWQFQFTPVGISSTGQVDMYLFGNRLGSAGALAVWAQGLATGGVVGSPASADSVIAVAAHTTKDCWEAIDGNGYCWNPLPVLNDIAWFSSAGPLRDGRIKPDLSAPGFGVASAKSSSTSPAPSLALQVPDGRHLVEAGTSMSSPHVAGAVALLLAQPAWAGAGPSAINARLRQTARVDAFTGIVPNPVWGAGKLDVAAALAPLVTLQILHPAKGQYLPPGKPDSVVVLLGGGTGADSVELALSLDGGTSFPIPLGTLMNVASGVPRSLGWFVDGSMSTTHAMVRGVAHTSASDTVSANSDSVFLIQAPVAVETIATSVAPHFELKPNTPNPFNPTTTIGFATESFGPVALRIYGPQGGLVRKLVDTPLPAGVHRVRWDGRDDRGTALASGIYFYELAAGGKRLTRKMSLLK